MAGVNELGSSLKSLLGVEPAAGYRMMAIELLLTIVFLSSV